MAALPLQAANTYLANLALIMITKKTKIVCTIGPATETQDKLEKLLEAGMNVMRLNFSHGDFKEHQGRVDNLKKATAKTGIPAAVLQDLAGRPLRITLAGTSNSVGFKRHAPIRVASQVLDAPAGQTSRRVPLTELKAFEH